MILLAVDPSIVAAGVAVWDVDREHVLMHDTLSQTGTDTERLLSLTSRLKRLVNEYSPDVCVVEVPTSLFVQRGRSQTALKLLLSVGGVIGAIGNAVTSCGMVTVEEWRGNRQALHKDVLIGLAGLWAPDVANDHEAEAVLVGAYFVNPFGLHAALTIQLYGGSKKATLAAWEKYRHHHAPGALIEAVSKADTRAFLRAKPKRAKGS